jgi:hypothetical protein
MNILNIFYSLTNYFGYFKNELLNTLILIIFLIVFYKGFSFYINKQEISHERKHRSLVNTRNVLSFIFVVLIFFIWIGEIKTSLLSAAAICSAIIITFKEIILSFFGTFISNQSFQLGDYIEIDGFSGKVINKSFLNTTILLNDTQQTQELIVPNLVFLNNKFKKLSKIPKVQFVSFAISVDSIEKIYKFSEIARVLAHDILIKYNPNYEEYFKQIEQITPYFDIPKSIVNIKFEISDPRKLQFIISFVCRPSQMSQIKDEILNQYLQTISTIIEKEKLKGKIPQPV